MNYLFSFINILLEIENYILSDKQDNFTVLQDNISCRPAVVNKCNCLLTTLQRYSLLLNMQIFLRKNMLKSQIFFKIKID